MKTKLTDLNEHLFSMIELLDDDEAMADEKKCARALERAKARKKHHSQKLSREIALFYRQVEQMTADGCCRSLPCKYCPVRLYNDIHPDKAVLCHRGNLDKLREVIAMEFAE